MKIIKLLFLIIPFFLSCSSEENKPIKTLIITGQNNHNWKVSHAALQQILENSTLFSVDKHVSPPEGEDMSEFVIDFSPYKLVVLDYVGDSWPKVTRDRFLDYVRNGGGVVVFHAANNAFTNWEEYNQIIALGGWNDRNEKSGPWLYWKNGKLVKDTSEGIGGSHGDQHEYVLTARSEEHPIVKGLPKQWKHAKDELYDRMRGPGNIEDLLYTAYSDTILHGSGREEPLIFTVKYGKGRVFHTMLGHTGNNLDDNIAMQCTGFQVLLLRGSEWAATGKVTQAIPGDFPTSETVTYRKEYKE